MTNYFYAIDELGNAHTRSSKNRTYTHAVVIKLGRAYADRKLARDLADTAKQAPKDYQFYLDVIDGSWFTKRGWAIDTKDQISYQVKLGGRSVEQFTAARLQEVRDEHAEAVARGVFDTWGCLGWCGRFDLAQKVAASGGAAGYKDVETIRILGALVGKPPKK